MRAEVTQTATWFPTGLSPQPTRLVYNENMKEIGNTEITFEIPGELTDLNTHLDQARTHWAKSGELKKQETNKAKMIASQYSGEFDEGDFPVDIHCHWVCKNRRKDKDNIRFAVKYILDGLELAGLIENDGWNYVGSLSDTFAVDKENPRVEVTITATAN